AVAGAGRPVNLKKGQFLSPWEMQRVVEKARSTGNADLLVTERGFAFGYNNLVSDMRALPVLAESGCPVVFDATHSVQQPRARGFSSGGARAMVATLARAAVGAGADAVFLEVHEDPERALSDGATSLRLDDLPGLLRQLGALARVVRAEAGRGAPSGNNAPVACWGGSGPASRPSAGGSGPRSTQRPPACSRVAGRARARASARP